MIAASRVFSTRIRGHADRQPTDAASDRADGLSDRGSAHPQAARQYGFARLRGIDVSQFRNLTACSENRSVRLVPGLLLLTLLPATAIKPAADVLRSATQTPR